eukprot:3189243-Prymnesium_polylepis.1
MAASTTSKRTREESTPFGLDDQQLTGRQQMDKLRRCPDAIRQLKLLSTNPCAVSALRELAASDVGCRRLAAALRAGALPEVMERALSVAAGADSGAEQLNQLRRDPEALRQMKQLSANPKAMLKLRELAASDAGRKRMAAALRARSLSAVVDWVQAVEKQQLAPPPATTAAMLGRDEA